MDIIHDGKMYYIDETDSGKQYIEMDVPHSLKQEDTITHETENKIYTISFVGFGKVYDIYERDSFMDKDRKSIGEKQRLYIKCKYKRKEA